MADPLENCPCCDTAVIIDESQIPNQPNHKYIQCTTCGLNMIGYSTEEELITAWNRRDYVG